MINLGRVSVLYGWCDYNVLESLLAVVKVAEARARPHHMARRPETRPGPARPSPACLTSQRAFGRPEPDNIGLWADVIYLSPPVGRPSPGLFRPAHKLGPKPNPKLATTFIL